MRERWRKANKEDIDYVVDNLRQADIEECKAMWGVSPRRFFEAFEPDSNTYAILARDNTPMAIGGIVPVYDNVAQIWMVATPVLEDHSIEFLRHTEQFIDEVSEGFDLLYNYVDERNSKHIKWLKWSGFTFISKKPKWGKEGLPFFEFVKVT